LALVICDDTDVPQALALSDAAHWNQVADDWRVFIRDGHTLGLRSAGGPLVATAAALPYGAHRGWVSMVLVAASWRHQGLASRLLSAGVAHLRQRGATPCLDATPAGAPTYQKAGFRTGFGLARWEGQGAATHPTLTPPVRRADAVDLPRMVALDGAANGMQRQFLLHDILARKGTRAWITTNGDGFVISRLGRRATQLGPLVARNEHDAAALLLAALDQTGGPVFLDLPDRWQMLSELLTRRGFVQQRPFVRMAMDGVDVQRANDRMFLLAGPEFG